MNGDGCEVEGDCVSSKNYPNFHGNHESCTVTMLEDAAVVVGSTFDVEAGFDKLNIRGVDRESAGSIPRSLNKGEVFTWTSDQSETRSGWQICFEERSSITTTAPPGSKN